MCGVFYDEGHGSSGVGARCLEARGGGGGSMLPHGSLAGFSNVGARSEISSFDGGEGCPGGAPGEL